MNVLVTGGAGFIGANLVRLLLEEGHRVRVLDNFSTGQPDYLEGLDLEIIEGDILDRDVVTHAVRGMEGIVHLAAQTGVPGSIKNPRFDCRVNVMGTLNMLEAARKEGVDRFIFASSNAPLGRQEPPATEDKAPLPIAPYGASKLAGEGYCLAYHGSWGLGTVVLRFANVYGPYSKHKNSVVAKFFKDIMEKGEITIHGDGEQTRDFIYVEDLCWAILLSLESDISGEIFQIASEKETLINELANVIRKLVEKEFSIKHGSRRRGDVRKSYSRINKATTELEWIPDVILEEGLRRTWAWLKCKN